MILIVDDKQENLFSLKTLLQLHGYRVDTALSGEEALRRVLKNEYALVILDVQMSGMDGYEVAEALQGYSKTSKIPILFLSAVHLDKRFIAKGYTSGGVDYITKPFDADVLMLKVKTFYRLSEQARELRAMQKMLETEIEVRKAAQKALQNVNLLLEDKVAERTRDLLQTNRELELRNTELQQFASLATHDLQEPLRKIITYSNLICEKFLDSFPDLGPYVNKIIGSSERMRILINDLLNYSKLSVSAQFTATGLNDVLNETLSDLELSIREKGATVEVADLPAAEVVPGQIRQVFQNLICNSLKFSKSGTAPVIRIWSEDAGEAEDGSKPDAPEEKRVRICISDNGIGFNETYRNKIFTMFKRLHPPGDYEGTGIGLAIVKKIVENHHGKITAAGTEGAGATFTIELPLRQPARPAPPPPSG